MERNDFIRQFVQALPLCRAMDIRLVEREGETVFALPFAETLIGDAKNRIIHGGAISTLLDTACGAMVISHPENTKPSATVDLRIDYMRPALPESDIYASAEVYQTTRHIAFVRGLAWDETRERPVAMATGTFTFAKRKAKS